MRSFPAGEASGPVLPPWPPARTSQERCQDGVLCSLGRGRPPKPPSTRPPAPWCYTRLEGFPCPGEGQMGLAEPGHLHHQIYYPLHRPHCQMRGSRWRGGKITPEQAHSTGSHHCAHGLQGQEVNTAHPGGRSRGRGQLGLSLSVGHPASSSTSAGRGDSSRGCQERRAENGVPSEETDGVWHTAGRPQTCAHSCRPRALDGQRVGAHHSVPERGPTFGVCGGSVTPEAASDQAWFAELALVSGPKTSERTSSKRSLNAHQL